MPINADQNCGIDPNVGPCRSMPDQAEFFFLLDQALIGIEGHFGSMP